MEEFFLGLLGLLAVGLFLGGPIVGLVLLVGLRRRVKALETELTARKDELRFLYDRTKEVEARFRREIRSELYEYEVALYAR